MRTDSIAISSGVASRKLAVPVFACFQAARPASAPAGVSQTTKCPCSAIKCPASRRHAGSAELSSEPSAVVPAANRAGALLCTSRKANGSHTSTSRAGSDNAPPREKSRCGKLRSVFREASGSTCSVAMCPALPHEARCHIAAGSTRVVRMPRCCRFNAQLEPMSPPPTTSAPFGIASYFGGCCLRWLSRSSRTPLMCVDSSLSALARSAASHRSISRMCSWCARCRFSSASDSWMRT